VITYQTEVLWATAETYTPRVLDKLIPMAWTPGTFINVNFPNVRPDQVTGIRLTSQGLRPPGTFKPVRRVDERHVPYYWIKIAHTAGGDLPGTDLEAIGANAVSVTPLKLDMTDRALMARLGGLFG
jgi:5'-nucleotidase